VTSPSRRPAGHPGNRQAVPPSGAHPKAGEKDQAEVTEPYDLPGPDDQHPPGRPAYLIVVDQLRDRQSTRSPSLAELLEPGTGRTRQPEPDLEAEP
jgi:hypothetical protein